MVKYSIEECEDPVEYGDAWNELMNEYYWYKESPVFDWNKDEEIAAIRRGMGQEGHLFLIARDKKSNRILGLMGARFAGERAQLRRWEPTVATDHADSSMGTDLLQEMAKQLKFQGVKNLRVLLKQPRSNPETSTHLKTLYESQKFKPSGKPSVDLVLKLQQIVRPVEPSIHYEVRTGAELTPEQIASYVIKAYASSPEDLALFEPNSMTTDYDRALEFTNMVIRGDYGPAPNEFRRALFVNGEPAAIIGAFVLESEFKPLTGVLGPVGVFPEFRRNGIGRFLVQQVVEALRRFGCEYVAVGTEAANKKAIGLYEKVGFRLACDLQWYERHL